MYIRINMITYCMAIVFCYIHCIKLKKMIMTIDDTLMCLNIGTPETINFSFGTLGHLKQLSFPLFQN